MTTPFYIKIIAASALLVLSACSNPLPGGPNMVDYSYVPPNGSVVTTPGIESF